VLLVSFYVAVAVVQQPVDCKKAPLEKWPNSCIEIAEKQALAGDVEAMEALSIAYPNAGNTERSYYWSIEAARRGSKYGFELVTYLCPRPPQITKESVLEAIQSAAALDETQRTALRTKLRQHCP